MGARGMAGIVHGAWASAGGWSGAAMAVSTGAAAAGTATGHVSPDMGDVLGDRFWRSDKKGRRGKERYVGGWRKIGFLGRG